MLSLSCQWQCSFATSPYVWPGANIHHLLLFIQVLIPVTCDVLGHPHFLFPYDCYSNHLFLISCIRLYKVNCFSLIACIIVCSVPIRYLKCFVRILRVLRSEDPPLRLIVVVVSVRVSGQGQRYTVLYWVLSRT